MNIYQGAKARVTFEGDVLHVDDDVVLLDLGDGNRFVIQMADKTYRIEVIAEPLKAGDVVEWEDRGRVPDEPGVILKRVDGSIFYWRGDRKWYGPQFYDSSMDVVIPRGFYPLRVVELPEQAS